jgi:hypothetical protein
MHGLLVDFAWGCGYAALMWCGGIAGLVVSDWRARRRGEPIDRGMFWAYPGDPDY